MPNKTAQDCSCPKCDDTDTRNGNFVSVLGLSGLPHHQMLSQQVVTTTHAAGPCGCYGAKVAIMQPMVVVPKPSVRHTRPVFADVADGVCRKPGCSPADMRGWHKATR